MWTQEIVSTLLLGNKRRQPVFPRLKRGRIVIMEREEFLRSRGVPEKCIICSGGVDDVNGLGDWSEVPQCGWDIVCLTRMGGGKCLHPDE